MNISGGTQFPWYAVANGEELEQGDFIENCPVFIPPKTLAVGRAIETEVEFDWVKMDLIIISQTCDMANDKIEHILLCPLWDLSKLDEGNPLGKKNIQEDIRKARRPAYHMLSSCVIVGIEKDIKIVEFATTHSLPTPFIRERAKEQGPRVRLLPPYREHLSQAFARFFMRVGLPVDIPEIK